MKNNNTNIRFTVLIADDDEISLSLLQAILESEYKVIAVNNGLSARDLAIEKKPDLIILDVQMPELDGYQVCSELRNNPRTHDIPIIFVSGLSNTDNEKQGFEVGGVDYIVKPLRAQIIYHRVKNHLFLANQQHICNYEIARKTRQLKEATIEQIMALMRAARFKEHETANHTLRTGLMAWMIAMDMNMGKTWAQQIFMAAPMHDIGKIGVPDEILLSPLNLRVEKPEWWEIMKQHTIYGRDIIGKNLHTEIMKMASNIAIGHHEKIDGTGYPYGLQGEKIPLEARLTAVVDMIDAMMDKSRPYRDGAIPDEVIKDILNKEREQQLDDKIVDSAFKNWTIIKGLHDLFSGEKVPLKDYVYLSEDELADTLYSIFSSVNKNTNNLV